MRTGIVEADFYVARLQSLVRCIQPVDSAVNQAHGEV